MAMTATLSNHFKYLLATAAIDFNSDTFTIILMNTTFAFDKDAHTKLSEVTSDQLATLYGYTQDNKEIELSTLTEDDTNDKAAIVFGNVTWTANGGDIGPTGAAVIYDNTTANDEIVGCIDFGTDYTVPEDSNFQLQTITVNLA